MSELYKISVNQDEVWNYLAGKSSDPNCAAQAEALKEFNYKKLASIWALTKERSRLYNLTVEALNVNSDVMIRWKNCLAPEKMRRDNRRFEETLQSKLSTNSTLEKALEKAMQEYEYLTETGDFKRDAMCLSKVATQREMARLYIIVEIAANKTKNFNATISDYLEFLNKGAVKFAQTCLKNSITNTTNFEKAMEFYFAQNPAKLSDFKYTKDSYNLYISWANIKNPECIKKANKIPGIPNVDEVEARFNKGKATTEELVALLSKIVYPESKEVLLKCLGK
eukprot:CAMPEP_0176440460 /NCGR_PEP_ID=MMETSP0127-20121128/20586_1 /TAXON_ID=938130 /ORGANISM="Platyophrya macrostoma, Strain WH" /LENGTH=280 /DNA_ID=CAMNT_0017824993 /DNA_START=84 /DNA_END=926 /DNA_ORIENTATION=-